MEPSLTPLVRLVFFVLWQVEMSALKRIQQPATEEGLVDYLQRRCPINEANGGEFVNTNCTFVTQLM